MKLWLLLLIACGDKDGADGSAGDSGAVEDGGSSDGGALDGASPDGGATDGGATDGGSSDGGATDGGSSDGGLTDGGTPRETCAGDAAALHVPADHATLQDAVDAAEAGASICIAAGEYFGVTDLHGKALTIEGAGETVRDVVLDGDGEGPVINAEHADALILSWLTIHGGRAERGAGLSTWATELTLDHVELADNICEPGIIPPDTEANLGGCAIYAYGFDGYDNVRHRFVDTGFVANGSRCPDGETCNVTGGALYVHGDAELERVAFQENVVSGAGEVYGVAAKFYGGAAALHNVVVAGNQIEGASSARGALAFVGATDIQLHQLDVVGNRLLADDVLATGIYTSGGLLTASGLQLAHNGGEDADGDAVPALSLSSKLLGLRYSNVHDNGDAPFDGLDDPTGTDGNISADPLYADRSSEFARDWDLTLSSGSPAIDAGDPHSLDDDGSRADIGGYGGPGGSAW